MTKEEQETLKKIFRATVSILKPLQSRLQWEINRREAEHNGIEFDEPEPEINPKVITVDWYKIKENLKSEGFDDEESDDIIKGIRKQMNDKNTNYVGEYRYKG